MGGAAFEFPITPSADLLERARQHRGSFIKRLFRPSSSPVSLEVQLGQVLPLLPKQLLGDFKAWLARTMPQPWAATHAVIRSYLSLIGPSAVTFAHGMPDKNRENWCLNVRLSGCGGMAECSAWLIAHWLEIWFRRNGERLDRELLSPAGLTVGTGDPESLIAGERFLPVGVYGYALFHPELADMPDADLEEQGDIGLFELDGALDEANGRKSELTRELLRARYTGLMRDGRCRCQLCMPDFDPTALDAVAA